MRSCLAPECLPASECPPGWGVVESLVRLVAAAADEPLAPHDDWQAWWRASYPDAKLGYSTLLAELEPTSAGRRALLAGFFEPAEDERENGLKVTGPAHRAIARLVAQGVATYTSQVDKVWARENERGCAAFTRTMELAGKKWTPGLMLALMKGATRSAKLRAAVPGLTDRLLAQRLRELGAHDLVSREVINTMPVGVRYTLAERGQELMRALHPLLRYGQRWDETGQELARESA